MKGIKKYFVSLLALGLLVGCSQTGTNNQSSLATSQVSQEEPSLQQEIDLSKQVVPEVKFDRLKLKTYEEIYQYLQDHFGQPINQEETETIEGVFLKSAYFKSPGTGNQYFVAQNEVPELSDQAYTYFGIIAYSPEALDLGLDLTAYAHHREEILASNRYQPYVQNGVAISYREVPVTDKQMAYGISIFDAHEYEDLQEVLLIKTE